MMKKLWFLVVWFLAFLFLGNGAFAQTYTQVFSDNFNRTNGPVGNNWETVGLSTGDWSIYNNTAITTAGLRWSKPLLRPINENLQDGKIEFIIPASVDLSQSVAFGAIARFASGSIEGTYNGYHMYYYPHDEQFFIGRKVNSPDTNVNSGAEAINNDKHTTIVPIDGDKRIEFIVLSSNATTFIAVNFYDSSIIDDSGKPAKLIYSRTVFDSTPELQTTGQRGLEGFSNTSVEETSNFDSVAIYSSDTIIDSTTIGFIGDSITDGNRCSSNNYPSTVAVSDLGLGFIDIKRGISGATSASYLSTNLADTISDFQNAGIEVVHIMLGTNDSKVVETILPAEYVANMQAIIAQLKVAGIRKIIISYPITAYPWTNQTAIANLKAIIAVIPDLIDGETVFLGDIAAYPYFSDNLSTVSCDTIHPNAIGNIQLGQFWANAYTRLLIDPYESGFAQFITNGTQHTWNTNTTLIYEVQKKLSRFTMTGFAGVEVDGTELTGENYLVDGTTTTTITLKADYLNTLSTGNHLLTIKFSDGIITTGNFIIVSAPLNPNTPSGWGGGGSSASKDNCPNGDFSASYYDGTCGTPDEQETTTWNNAENPASNDKVGTGLVPVRDEGEAEGIVNQEILTAYQFAYAHNITTLAPIEAAMPDGTVIRGHLAKMVVNYALNVLWKTLPSKVPASCHRKDGANARESSEMKDYAVKACSLGLMGIDMEYFQPYAQVSRAQFWTVLSRLLYGNEYAGGKPYYANHLQALKEKGILTQIEDPEARVELRQWVRLMLMRSAK